jgi:quercetin dioxygenase-like cupin family protein
MNATVAPEVVEVAVRALALAAGDGWPALAIARILDELRPLQIDGRALVSLLELPAPDGWPALEIGEGNNAHATLFAMRRGQSMPLHDHPSMTVICKVLFGSIRIRTLVWTDRAAGVARDLGERVMGLGDEALLLAPEPGTIHAIEALEDCAFLDLFSPYYDDDRECSDFEIANAGGSPSLVTLRRRGDGDLR